MPTKKIVIIEKDFSPESCSPRETECLSTIYCWHKNYVLGDEQPKESPEEWENHLADQIQPGSLQKLEKFADKAVAEHGFTNKAWSAIDQYRSERIIPVIESKYVRLPVYMYDHSGITLSHKPFDDRFDSGQIGFMLVNHEDVKKAFPEWERISSKRTERIKEIMISELAYYSLYVEGNVYGFSVYDAQDYADNGNDAKVESACWGFVCDPLCLEESGMTEHWDENWRSTHEVYLDMGNGQPDYPLYEPETKKIAA